MAVSAYPDGPPVKCGFPVADIVTSFYASQAILASLFARERDGKGRYVEISLLESMLGVMCSVTSSWLLAATEVKPMGATQGSIVPYQIFRAADGMMVIGAPNERLWQGFCRALDREDLIQDPRFARNELRVKHRDELIPVIDAELAKHPRDYWIESSEREQVPCGPVLSTPEALRLAGNPRAQAPSSPSTIPISGPSKPCATPCASPAWSRALNRRRASASTPPRFSRNSIR